MWDSNSLRRRGVTMIEILVVAGVIAILASILLPSLASARASASAVMCKSNLAQVVRANLYYADENESTYCAGAEAMRPTPARRRGINLHRWYGTRARRNEPFQPSGGPLTPYLGKDGRIRQCPAFPAEEIARESGGFERGAGGYGYNNAFVGMQVHHEASGEYTVISDAGGARTHWVKKPSATVMFADAAFAGRTLIEYSFVEPRYQPQFPRFRADPSIHFRHRVRANVGWVDGHVDARNMTFTSSSGIYSIPAKRYDIGWFGERDDNSLFDLE